MTSSKKDRTLPEIDYENTHAVCDCTHEESEHVFTLGCKLCQCECYSQVKQVRKNGPYKL